MIIRLARKRDLHNIMKMYKSCVMGMIAHNITEWDNKYPNQEIILKDLKNKTYFVAEKNNEVIGGINIDKVQDEVYNTIKWNDKSEKFLVVHRLAVRAEFWNQNVGKKLMSFAENRAIKNNLSSIRLDTYSENPIALKFYEKIGYLRLGAIDLKPGKKEYYCFEKLLFSNTN